MIKTILIDDEPLALKHLAAIITKHCPQLQILATASTVDESLEKIETYKPSLIFLDIELAGESSFEILEQNHPRSYEVIFITAHDNYGIKALKQNAVDYILKPINKSEFLEAVNRAIVCIEERKRLNSGGISKDNSSKKISVKLALPTLEGLLLVETEKIMYCESDGRYTNFYLDTQAKKLMVSRNLGEYEGLLPAESFFRIHHHTIVNLKYISKYVKGRGGYVVMNNGQKLEVSARRRDEFLTRLA